MRAGREPVAAPGPAQNAENVRCGRRWKGHVCKLPATTTSEAAPPGQHEHECLCGIKWVSRHEYHRSKFSGAGNCWCGRHEEAKTHA